LAVTLTKILKELGIKNIILIGGEPTLWKPLFQYNDFCKAEGLNSILITNGLSLASDRFFEQYKEHPCGSLGISMKGGTAEQYARVAKLKNFSLIKKSFTRIAENFNKFVNITFNSFYLEPASSLVDMAKFASDCGFAGMKFEFCTTTFVDGERVSKYMVHPHKTVVEIMKNLTEMRKHLKIIFEMNLPFCVWPREFIEEFKGDGSLISACHVMRNEGVVFDTDGKTMICNTLFDYPTGKYGIDFTDSESYLKFRQSKQVASYYDQIISYPSFRCMDCSSHKECGGGCPLLWFIFKPDDIIKTSP
jgi:radical SAM protein with 4Fe4S-binding SPASM domain